MTSSANRPTFLCASFQILLFQISENSKKTTKKKSHFSLAVNLLLVVKWLLTTQVFTMQGLFFIDSLFLFCFFSKRIKNTHTIRDECVCVFAFGILQFLIYGIFKRLEFQMNHFYLSPPYHTAVSTLSLIFFARMYFFGIPLGAIFFSNSDLN